MRNGGNGIALTIGVPVVVQTCDQEPTELAARGSQAIRGPLGTYVLPSGSSDQLAFVSTRYRHVEGNVSVQSKSLWYTFDYDRFGLVNGAGAFGNFLIWYTDGARSKLRWVCIQYQFRPADSRGRETEWAVNEQTYGVAPLPAYLKVL
jgi:hypothetical protein